VDPPRFWFALFARMTFGFVVLFGVLHAMTTWLRGRS
jgi:hypothetical protein